MVSISLTVTDVSKKFDRLLDATYDIERQIAGLNGQVGLLHGLLQERPPGRRKNWSYRSDARAADRRRHRHSDAEKTAVSRWRALTAPVSAYPGPLSPRPRERQAN